MGYFGALIFLCMVFVNATNVGAMISATSLECIWTPKVCAATPICKMVKPRGNAAYLNADCFVMEPLDDVMAISQLYRKVNKVYEPIGLNLTLNICKMTDASNKDLIVGSLMKLLMKRIKNLNCPLRISINAAFVSRFIEQCGLYGKDHIPQGQLHPIKFKDKFYRQ